MHPVGKIKHTESANFGAFCRIYGKDDHQTKQCMSLLADIQYIRIRNMKKLLAGLHDDALGFADYIVFSLHKISMNRPIIAGQMKLWSEE